MVGERVKGGDYIKLTTVRVASLAGFTQSVRGLTVTKPSSMWLAGGRVAEVIDY